jgi:hypothetical protein
MVKPKVKMIRGKIGGGWETPFDDPIPLPRGRQLVTLQDAGTYITKLPKVEAQAPEWQTAMQALLLVVKQNGPTMFARIGMMQALHRNVERACSIQIAKTRIRENGS